MRHPPATMNGKTFFFSLAEPCPSLSLRSVPARLLYPRPHNQPVQPKAERVCLCVCWSAVVGGNFCEEVLKRESRRWKRGRRRRRTYKQRLLVSKVVSIFFF